ncbi:CYTH-like domain-containing protein [Aspergillus avenaceus]|uniref:CYTH-like domain-containing protein n=1 Tax=Aspergillus avenaceus TaxID=36643 RepID=A0A5N6TVH1_ASPAV|nr:CYTH-like domain-containing protein [Aspergillus avenaceus]
MLLEVERKFHHLTKHLTSHGGTPSFQALNYLGKTTFHDIYYDKAHLLSSKGVWIRQRDGNWQAKIKRGGDYTNSKFDELTTSSEIARYLAQLGFPDDEKSKFGLNEMASFSTLRESWVADREFTIVQDVTDFGHTVGEVELECRLERVGSEIEFEKLRAKKMAEMDERIVGFMRRYSWAFCAGVPKGKLTAYFERFPGC